MLVIIISDSKFWESEKNVSENIEGIIRDVTAQQNDKLNTGCGRRLASIGVGDNSKYGERGK
jgi:hypothetical protein